MYEYRTVTNVAERERIIQSLFVKNGDLKTVAHVKWQYSENPLKKSYLEVAICHENQEMAGIYSAFCLEFDYFGKYTRGVQSLDTLTDKNHRGQGLFIKLASRMYDYIEQQGEAIIFGFPNVNSAHGFFDRLQWVKLNPTPFLIRVLSLKFILRKLKCPVSMILPDTELFLTTEETDPRLHFIKVFDERADILWQKFSLGKFVAVRRGSDYLNWRYVAKPDFRYRRIGFFDESGELLGFIVGSLQQKHGTVVLYIMELIYDPAVDSNIADVLLDTMVAIGKKAGAEVTLAWVLESAPTYKNFKKKYYYHLPECFRPIELNFGYRKLANKTDLKRSDFYISYSDSDTV